MFHKHSMLLIFALGLGACKSKKPDIGSTHKPVSQDIQAVNYTAEYPLEVTTLEDTVNLPKTDSYTKEIELSITDLTAQK